MQIRVLTTGGTIDKIYYDRKDAFTVGEPQIGDLLREANVALDWVIEPLLRKDSLDLCEEDRLLARPYLRSRAHPQECRSPSFRGHPPRLKPVPSPAPCTSFNEGKSSKNKDKSV